MEMQVLNFKLYVKYLLERWFNEEKYGNNKINV